MGISLKFLGGNLTGSRSLRGSDDRYRDGKRGNAPQVFAARDRELGTLMLIPILAYTNLEGQG